MLPDLLISSRRNPLVRRLRSLATRAGREREGMVLLEGTHLLQEQLLQGVELHEVIATDPGLNAIPSFWGASILRSRSAASPKKCCGRGSAR